MLKRITTPYRALSIAGFDGSGGAGIQADLKTFSALGCYGMTVLTALPVQNTCGVQTIYDISEQCVHEQLLAIIEDVGVDVIKIGMLHRTAIIETVLAILKKGHFRIVLDPVMVAKSGNALISRDAVEALKQLFPLATVLTPNIPEAEVLLGYKIDSKEVMEKAALDLVHRGPKAVIVKGGHLPGNQSHDCLCLREGERIVFHWLSVPRTETHNTHGSGCTFSAAIASYLAKGLTILEASTLAKDYISQAIKAGASFALGKGKGPVHHFHTLWP